MEVTRQFAWDRRESVSHHGSAGHPIDVSIEVSTAQPARRRITGLERRRSNKAQEESIFG